MSILFFLSPVLFSILVLLVVGYFSHAEQEFAVHDQDECEDQSSAHL